MEIQPATKLWLLNNNDSPQRSQRQGPGGPGGRPGGPTQPKRSSRLNIWLLIIFAVMAVIYLYQYFNANNTSSNAPQRDELTYTQFYEQINAGNIKDATLIGQTDITGDFRTPVNNLSQYHVYQLPNGDNQLPQLLISKGATVVYQNPPDNSFWINLLIAFLPWVLLIGLFIFFSRRAHRVSRASLASARAGPN